MQLAVLDGREVVYVERRESPHTVRLFGRIGNRAPVHCTGTGKLLLAFLSPDELDQRLEGIRLARRTPYTITSISALRADLDQIRIRGWAENVNESEMGIASISAPIRDRGGAVIAAVSVAGPVQRVNGDNLRRFVRPVTDAAAQISYRLAGGFAEPREATS